jgi:glycosyltransferase involved in cell wall biosynthesis
MSKDILKIQPLVSVVITAYNRENYIKDAIQSTLNQDYPNLEIIISNNASTDNTHLVITKFLSDPRIKYYLQESNIGMKPNFKYAASKANGKFITFLSSDDYFINNSFISQSILLAEKYENISLILGTYNRVVEKSNEITVNVGGIFDKEYYKGDEMFMKFPLIKSISFAAALMNKQIFNSLGVFDNPCSAFDVLVLLKLMLNGNVACINKPSYMLRVHGNNFSTKITIQQAIENFIYITEPYQAALKKGIRSKEELDQWQTDAGFLYARYITIQFAPQNKLDYYVFIKYLKDYFPKVVHKLRFNLKWNVLIFFFKRPVFSLKFFKKISKSHYIYLNSLIDNKKNQ